MKNSPRTSRVVPATTLDRKREQRAESLRRKQIRREKYAA